MARYPRDNEEADRWLRRIVKEFLRGKWRLDQYPFACRSHPRVIEFALFGTAPITESMFVRMVNGLEYLVECEHHFATGGPDREA